METNPNAKCPCGSGKKFKKCCQWNDSASAARELAEAEAIVAKMTETELVSLNQQFEEALAKFVQRNNDPELAPDFKQFLREKGVETVYVTEDGLMYDELPVFVQRDFRKLNNESAKQAV